MHKKTTFIIIAFLLLIVGSVHQPPLTIADTVSVKITADVVNVRENPGPSFRVIDQVRKGEQFSVENEQGDWIQIKLDAEQTGWVASWLTEKQQREVNKTATITVNNLNVRTEPSTNSEVIGQLHKGDLVTVQREENSWSQISFQSRTAWVSSQYVRIGTTDATLQTNDHQQVAILHDGTNIRKKADIHSQVITQVHAGEVFEKIAHKGDWYQIKLANGKKGYVASWVVSLTDRPVFYKKDANGIKNKVIVIDAGHGGRDQGAEGVAGTLEKDLTLETAQLLAKKLTSDGAKVIMTRSKDQYIALNERTAAVTSGDADAMISLHYDSADNARTGGHTTYYSHSYEKRLADTIHHHLKETVELKSRGIRFGNYFVTRESERPAVLLELGYLSNPSEEKTIQSHAFQDAATTAIYNGLVEYFSN